MKIQTFTAYFLLMAASVIWLGNMDGRANGGNEGATGAPNDNPNNRTCQNCHNNSSQIQVTLDIELLDQNQELVTVYEPGEAYTVRVRLNSVGNTDPAAYGFQMVALTDDLTPVNTWEDTPPSGIQVTTLNNGRAYAEHLQPSTENVFEITWEAPASGSGEVTFYACGNGVNGNNATSGDGAAINELTIPEFGTVASEEVLRPGSDFNFFPNPASDVLTIEWLQAKSQDLQISILDQQGRRLLSRQHAAGPDAVQLPVEDLPAGMYFLEIRSETAFGVQRFIVL